MARSIADTLRHLQGGTFLDEASDQLAELVRPDRTLEDAARTLTASITEKTGFPMFHGNPFVR